MCVWHSCAGTRGWSNCLDDTRTLALVRSLADGGLRTLVIGIPTPTDPNLESTLDRLAEAGGLPRAGMPRYYRAVDASELTAAFRVITSTLVRCRFVTTPVRMPDQVSLSLDSVRLARDPLHLEGWDWSDPATGELALYGRACEAAADRAEALRLQLSCLDD